MPVGSVKYSCWSALIDATRPLSQTQRQIDPDPGEQHVEVERRVEEVVRVERAPGEAQRPRHDRHFVGVVHRRKPVLQADDAQGEREKANACAA